MEGTGRAATPPSPRCTKCNSPLINGLCTNFILFDVALYLPMPTTEIKFSISVCPRGRDCVAVVSSRPSRLPTRPDEPSDHLFESGRRRLCVWSARLYVCGQVGRCRRLISRLLAAAGAPPLHPSVRPSTLSTASNVSPVDKN